ncbi:hypothetical protein OHA72_23370 [Dactylosporangium sp. NBC_01737]|uniref:hypothetical protein n=1 Tax=Dactylosporangium sp. NBC_01737 TaxID=2975959 RepID=UPI002E142441|nr:hypothetical protein OHA72_23370 [Dactylosporangium sp. NBC_01737]
MSFDPGEYRTRVLARLRKRSGLADPRTGDPFLVCAIDLDATTQQVTDGLDRITAFWRKERDKPAYRGVVHELLSHRDAYAEELGTAPRRAAAAARVRAMREVSDQQAGLVLDRLAAGLRRAHGAVHRPKVKVLESIAAEEGMGGEAFQAWLARQEVTEEPLAAQPWDPALRRQIRDDLDQLAQMDRPHAERYRTLLTFLGVGSHPSPDSVRRAYDALVERNRAVVQDSVTSRTEQLLSQVHVRLLAEDGIERYSASLRADAEELLATELRWTAQLTGLLQAPDTSAMAARVVGLAWGIADGEALEVVRRAAITAGLAVEVNTAVRLIVCAGCGRPQAVTDSERCAYCPAELFGGCVVCGESIPRAADICPRCNAPCGVLSVAERTVPALRDALASGFVAEANRLTLGVLTVVGHPAAPAELAGLVAEAADRYAEANQQWAKLLRETRRGAVWAATSAAEWLATRARDVPSPDPASPATAVSRIPLLEQAQQDAVVAARRAAASPPEVREDELQRLLQRYPDCPQAQAALARIPLRPPVGLDAVVHGEDVEVSWRAAPAAPATLSYRVDRHVEWPPDLAGVTPVGSTTRTQLKDTGAPGGTVVRYTVTAVDGPRVSASVGAGTPRSFHRDVALLNASAVGRRAVRLEWPTEHLGSAEVTIEREVEHPGEGRGTTTRFRPVTAGLFFDETMELGVTYRYRVYLTYRDRAGNATRTSGREAVATVYAAPEPVDQLRALTGDDGRTTITYDAPPAGTVRVYALAGVREPFAASAARTALELDAEASAARLVGEGPQRVVDEAGRAVVTYRAVTVSGPDVALGAHLVHVAAPRPGGLRTIGDSSGRLRLGFDLPAGVSTALVRWSRLDFPTGPDHDTPATGSAHVTAAELAATGGYDIDVPEDGRAVYVAVHATAAAPGGGAPVVALAGARLLARRAVPTVVRYSVNIKRFMSRVDIDVSTADGRPLPVLAVVLHNSAEPATASDGDTVCSYASGTPTVALQVKREDLCNGYLRLFALPEPGFVVEVHDPPLTSRRVVLS